MKYLIDGDRLIIKNNKNISNLQYDDFHDTYDLFEELWKIKEIVIPDNIKEIRVRAFQGFTEVESITIPDSVQKIEEGAFLDCSSLKHIKLPNSISCIEESTFAHCKALEQIELPQHLKEIKHKAFQECSSLKNLILPDSMENIRGSAFANCDSIELTIPATEKLSITGDLFYKCQKATLICGDATISLGNPLYQTNYFHASAKDLSMWETLDRYTIQGTKLIVNEGVEELSSKDFHYVSFPTEEEKNSDILANIGFFINRALKQGMENITEIYLPDSVKTIGEETFSCFENLKSIRFSESLEKIGEIAFFRCRSLKEVCLPQGLQEIGEGAFHQCYLLNTINIPSKISVIPDCCFYECGLLNNVNIEGTIKQIGECAFANCGLLDSFVFNAGLEFIGHNAFSCCGFDSVKLPETVKTIEHRAFEGCPNLQYIEIPKNVINLGSEVAGSHIPFKLVLNKNDNLNIENGSLFSLSPEISLEIVSSDKKVIHFHFRKEDIAQLAQEPSLFHYLIEPSYELFKTFTDTDLKIKLALEHHQENKQYHTYLKRNAVKVLQYASKKEDMAALDYIIDNNLISKKKIDECIEYVRKNDFHEIFVMLTNYKNEIGGYDKTDNDRFDL